MNKEKETEKITEEETQQAESTEPAGGNAEEKPDEAAGDPQKNEGKKKSKKEKKDKQKEEIEELSNKLSAQKDSYMRLAAEYDNYRKRTANEKLSIYSDATAKAVEELLPVADSMQMAMQSLKDAPEEFRKGLELVAQQLDKAFEKLKIESFGEVGEDFDPNLHNAVSKAENPDLGENQLAMVFQKGYKIGDKVIRHAMVQVANCD